MTAVRRPRRWGGFRSVLCGVDFSEPSRHALQHAEWLAVRGHAALTVAYANDPLLAAAAAAAHDRGLAGRSAAELDAFVKSTLAAGSRTRLNLQTHVSVGDPAAEILALARRRRADVIVLGTQGLTGASRVLMGSTTLDVLRQTTRPVLAIPMRASTGNGVMSTSWPGRKVVAAVELDRLTAIEVAGAATIARWFDASLVLAHIVTRISTPAWFDADVSAYDRIRIAEAERQLDPFVRAARRRVETAGRVVCGSVAEGIAALATAEQSGLVLTALRDRRGWFGARRGSVSYDVLAHGTRPVLAYPSRWRPR